MRDPIDEAEDFVAHALQGGSWETRDDYPYPDGEPKCWVERGIGAECERFTEASLSYLDACKIETLLARLRGEE